LAAEDDQAHAEQAEDHCDRLIEQRLDHPPPDRRPGVSFDHLAQRLQATAVDLDPELLDARRIKHVIGDGLHAVVDHKDERECEQHYTDGTQKKSYHWFLVWLMPHLIDSVPRARIQPLRG